MSAPKNPPACRFPKVRRSGAFGYWGLWGLWVLTILNVLPAGFADEGSPGYAETPIIPDDRLHWSFRPLRAVDVPTSADMTWCRNEIDRFVVHKLDKSGLQPQPEASRRVLLRRLSFDLIGLPPTPQELEAFEADSAPQAYHQVVARLLTSPRYGERWAQHWLDLARFAETDGFEHDKVRPEAWKYRDWVVAAFNSDMPYDEFLRQQMAGDEIYPGNESAVTATRFCLSGPDMPDINLVQERRHNVLNELTATVGEVILGLQIGCAQCHDHKYDPVSQADFYRLRAVFEPAVRLQKNRSLSVLQETVPWSQPGRLMLRGDFRKPGPELSPGVVRVVSSADSTFAPQPSETSNGLRTALADWLVAKQNPLTARVFVNRIWQHHFGAGIVNTPSEFGIMGASPTHPELLDWLAVSFMNDGWSIKQLHRRIVMSAVYRQRSRLSEDATEDERLAWSVARKEDPRAASLSRFPRYRLEGETIRDAMLACSGQLNLKMGGPGVRPPLPQELVETLLKKQWEVTEDTSEHRRRSIYVFARRNLRYPVFEVFDRPSANSSCAVRGVSTTAPQSLHLLNSSFSLQSARHLAQSLRHDHAEHSSGITDAFVRTLGRPPTTEELDHVRRFWGEKPVSHEKALTHLCLSLFNCNEFVVID